MQKGAISVDMPFVTDPKYEEHRDTCLTRYLAGVMAGFSFETARHEGWDPQGYLGHPRGSRNQMCCNLIKSCPPGSLSHPVQPA